MNFLFWTLLNFEPSMWQLSFFIENLNLFSVGLFFQFFQDLPQIRLLNLLKLMDTVSLSMLLYLHRRFELRQHFQEFQFYLSNLYFHSAKQSYLILFNLFINTNFVHYLLIFYCFDGVLLSCQLIQSISLKEFHDPIYWNLNLLHCSIELLAFHSPEFFV